MSVAQQVTDAVGSDSLWNKEEQWMFAIRFIYVKDTAVVLDETKGHRSDLQLGLHAGPGTPPGTVASQIPRPKRCPQGSTHLCGGDMATYQVSGPKNVVVIFKFTSFD